MKPTILAAVLLPLVAAVLFLGLACRPSAAADPTVAPYGQWKHGPPADPDYFPIAVWLQGAQNAAKYKAAGINLYIALWQGPTEEQLADLKKAEMSVICDQNAVGLAHIDDPTIVGWMHGDEPDNAQPMKDPATGQDTYGPCIPPRKIVAAYDQMRAKDPSRPVMLNLGQGVANDQWIGRGPGASIDDYPAFMKGADIVSYDVYPVAGLNKPDGENYLWYVPKGLDRLVKWWNEDKRIIWNALECTRIDNPDKRATPAQVKAEVWMSLVHGSRGIIWFVHQFKPAFCEWQLLNDPEMLAAVTAINQQIHDLARVLNSPTIPGGAKVTSADEKVPVDAMVKRQDGATYVFAVGMRNAPTKATFEVAGLPAEAKAEVIGEGRTVAVKGGKFEDDFAAYGVHLYKVK